MSGRRIMDDIGGAESAWMAGYGSSGMDRVGGAESAHAAAKLLVWAWPGPAGHFFIPVRITSDGRGARHWY